VASVPIVTAPAPPRGAHLLVSGPLRHAQLPAYQPLARSTSELTRESPGRTSFI
jgi:hypothetical protein